MEFGIAPSIGIPTSVVEVDNRAETVEAAIVHVRARQPELAKCRRLEATAVFGATGDAKSAQVAGSPRYAGIVKLLVGEVRPDVAGGAICATAKQAEAASLGG